MKVLLTSPTFPPFNSGLGNAAYQQAMAMVQAGHEVVVATGGKERTSRMVAGFSVETFAVEGADFILRPIQGDIKGYTLFLTQTNWDAVVLNAWQNWATDLALRHLDEIPGRHFVFSHGISTNVFFPHQPVRSLIRFLAWRPYWHRITSVLRELDGVIFLANGGSDSRFDDFRQAVLVGATYHVVSNALSPAAVKDLAKQPPTFLERDRLIAVGSYQWQKGFDFVLRSYAASRFLNKMPLHFFGQKYTGYTEKLRHQAKVLGVDSNSVFFHEGVSGEALQAQYSLARLVLSGSHTECQPLALLDASATATPFIARATGCIDGMPGGVTIKNWVEMAQQIDSLVEESYRWQLYSDAARTAAETEYSPNVVTKKLTSVLEGVRNDISV